MIPQTPQGCFILLTKTLKRYRVAGNGKALGRYTASPQFMQLVLAVVPERRASAFEAWARADAACRKRKPIPKPGTAKRANWKDAAYLARFRNAYARGLADEDVASMMCLTLGATKMARKRFVDAPLAALQMAG